MEQIISQLMNGLVMGSVYALVALGLTLIYGILEIINLAHGELYMIGCYLSFFLYTKYHLPYAVCVLLSMIICAILGYVMEKLAFRPLRMAPKVNSLISALGLSIFLSNSGLILWSATPRSYSTDLSQKVLSFGNIAFSSQRVLIFGIALLLIGFFILFIKRTYAGKAMRAVAQDMEAASLMGIDINGVSAMTFSLGSALAAASGALVGPLVTLEPYMGLDIGVKAFGVVIMGGFGNIQGTIVAGFIIGIAESLGAALISPALMSSVVFSIIIIVLIFRPTGIFKEHVEENV
jgi:branched-chain amino acid transport system permease protein